MLYMSMYEFYELSMIRWIVIGTWCDVFDSLQERNFCLFFLVEQVG